MFNAHKNSTQLNEALNNENTESYEFTNKATVVALFHDMNSITKRNTDINVRSNICGNIRGYIQRHKIPKLEGRKLLAYIPPYKLISGRYSAMHAKCELNNIGINALANNTRNSNSQQMKNNFISWKDEKQTKSFYLKNKNPDLNIVGVSKKRMSMIIKEKQQKIKNYSAKRVHYQYKFGNSECKEAVSTDFYSNLNQSFMNKNIRKYDMLLNYKSLLLDNHMLLQKLKNTLLFNPSKTSEITFKVISTPKSNSSSINIWKLKV